MNIYTGDVCDTGQLVTRRTALPSTALVRHDSRLEGSSGRALILTGCEFVAWKAGGLECYCIPTLNQMQRETEDESAFMGFSYLLF